MSGRPLNWHCDGWFSGAIGNHLQPDRGIVGQACGALVCGSSPCCSCSGQRRWCDRRHRRSQSLKARTLAATASQREQPVHRVEMRVVQVVQLATLVNQAFQGLARLQLQSHEPVGIVASWYGSLTYKEWWPLLGVEGLEP